MDHMSLRSNSKVNASYCKYVMSYYEFIPAGDTEVFKPLAADPVPNKGIGYVKNNLLYSSRDKTKVYGHVGGLYFYHTEDVIEDVVTITFSEGLVRPWGGSSISLRGSWFMTPDGQADLDKQELGIVGGQGQFRGATGFVKYEKVQKDPQTVFHVTCHIYVPDFVGRDHEVEINLNELLEADAKPNGFHDAALRAPDVTIYTFQTNPPAANATAVTIYPPGILPPHPVGIPIVTVGNQPIRLTASKQLQIVGTQRVICVTGDTQDDQAWIQSTGVLDLTMNGRNGTISYSGIFNLSTGTNIPPAEDLGITGGTGAYESARLLSSVYPA
ncbi:hypothetical protein AXG93_492s1000 [Marchantia polymorpha subsp. ruderalis]|uniref:Dirigent protein n=1 Tax=Marchantia polymorpha subsp. ruderalis TaxID=1480154 RepID=A0A176W3J1_MARPO|nr:hypothetical protein AXG93_492s1000 [Marchantia polymorpha subsp. ruderalis]